MEFHRNSASRWGRVTSIIVIIAAVVLLVINIAYYYSTKHALIKVQNEKVRLIGDQVKIAIELSSNGEKVVEDLIGVNLRTAAIAAQAQLDPDIEKVSNEELEELSKLLGVDNITLMKRSDDDIIGYKSSDRREIGMSTKDWTNDWFEAFNQLLDRKDVTVKSGMALPNYWTGPFNTSASNSKNVDKWGYYHDGTTNYIIDPYVAATGFVDYQTNTGVDATIKGIVQNNQNSHTIEVSVFNVPIFLKHKKPNINNGVTWYRDRDILFGSYNYSHSSDAKYVQKAVARGENTYYQTEAEGKPILKTFIPVELEFPVVIGVVSDLSGIQSTLKEQLLYISVIIAISTAAAVAIGYGVVSFTGRITERAALSVQEVYVENIDTLFHSIKEQRHDFNNHVTTIHLLVALGQFDELKKYTKELIGEASALGDIININVPAVSALIQAKYTQAIEKKITFEHDIMDLKKLELGTVKSTELVKILSNLIDNAFDAVTVSDQEEKLVKVAGHYENNKLIFTVTNNGEPISEEVKEQIFQPGFSTKKNTSHSGLGLSIIKKTLKRYRGTIELQSDKNWTVFTVRIPL